MSNRYNTDLYSLIHAMDKAEKRFFKVLNVKNDEAEVPAFVRLFDLIAQSEEYNEPLFIQQLSGLNKGKMANLKRHLYQQLLKSLRLQSRMKDPEIQISEFVDHARILYRKGLYRQALKILDKALQLASESEDQILQLEIMEFEKRIEARHITRSRKIANKVEYLIDRSELMSEKLKTSVLLSNFALQIHGFYIKNGLVRNPENIKRIKTYFQNSLPDVDEASLDPVEKAYYYQGHMWYYYILARVDQVYKYGVKWVEIYRSNPSVLEKDAEPFLRGLHYVINACFYNRNINRILKYFKYFKKFKKRYENLMSPTTSMLFFIYYTNAEMNIYLLRGEYKKGVDQAPFIAQKIKEYSPFMDVHRVIIFYYKLAWFNFGRREFSATLDYLNQILNMKSKFLRNDISCYVKLLQLCAHLELNNRQLALSLLNSTERIFRKTNQGGPIIQSALHLIRTSLLQPDKMEQVRHRFLTDFDHYKSNRLEQHQVIYFNFYAWGKTMLQDDSIEKVIRKEYLSA